MLVVPIFYTIDDREPAFYPHTSRSRRGNRWAGMSAFTISQERRHEESTETLHRGTQAEAPHAQAAPTPGARTPEEGARVVACVDRDVDGSLRYSWGFHEYRSTIGLCRPCSSLRTRTEKRKQVLHRSLSSTAETKVRECVGADLQEVCLPQISAPA